MRTTLLKVTQGGASRVRNPWLLKRSVFKLFINIEAFWQIKAYTTAQYAKEVRTQTSLDYWCPLFCSQWQSRDTFPTPLRSPTPKYILSHRRLSPPESPEPVNEPCQILLIRWILSSSDHLRIFKSLRVPEDLYFLEHPSLPGTVELTLPLSTLHNRTEHRITQGHGNSSSGDMRNPNMPPRSD